LHTFGVGLADGRGRSKLIEEALLEHLRKKQRRLVRSRVVDMEKDWFPDEALVQLALESNEQGVFSVALPAERIRLRRCISRFVRGAVEVPRDQRPPSRAYRKLVEAEMRMARPIRPNERCVDLGASPGGWTFIALERGAEVTAVDRSPLRDDLMRNKRLHFVRGDAFAWSPPAKVDWLLCDLIAFPERTFELLERWLTQGWCQHFCVTVKFRGFEDYGRLADLKELLRKCPVDFDLRQLTNNKNEVTAMGSLTTS
jgi:23S rRNA (cytidine2498-2'-O)-methyltransferase